MAAITMAIDHLALIHLLRLASPSLPVGAFAYSQGLESACDANRVYDEHSAGDWIAGVLEHSIGFLDLPLACRLYDGWVDGGAKVSHYNERLLCGRETSELRAEERQMGRSLAKLLVDLGVDSAALWRDHRDTTFANMFMLAAVRWEIPRQAALTGLAWSWADNQITAAVKLVPLGQTSAQRLSVRFAKLLQQVVIQAGDLSDDELAGALPGALIASARHETQYSRLFRS